VTALPFAWFNFSTIQIHTDETVERVKFPARFVRKTFIQRTFRNNGLPISGVLVTATQKKRRLAFITGSNKYARVTETGR
jgi:hypothetical protein